MPTEGKPARRKQAPASPWCGVDVDVDRLSEPNRLAHEIVVARRDLLPSVERIMSSSLGDDARCLALTAFRTSLTTPGDPNRDPNTAIRNAQPI